MPGVLGGRVGAEWLRRVVDGDLVLVPVGGNGGDLSQPPGVGGRVTRGLAEGGKPCRPVADRPHGQLLDPLLNEIVGGVQVG